MDAIDKEVAETLTLTEKILGHHRPERRAAVKKLYAQNYKNTLLAALRVHNNNLRLKIIELEDGSIN